MNINTERLLEELAEAVMEQEAVLEELKELLEGARTTKERPRETCRNCGSSGDLTVDASDWLVECGDCGHVQEWS